MGLMAGKAGCVLRTVERFEPLLRVREARMRGAVLARNLVMRSLTPILTRF